MEATGALRSLGDLLHQTGLGKDLQQLLDDKLEVVLTELHEGRVRALQVLAELSAGGQEPVGTVQAGARGVRVGGGDRGLVRGAEDPRVDQPLLAGTLERVEVVTEIGDVDGEGAAHLVEERLRDLGSQGGVGVTQGLVGARPAVLLPGDPGQVLVVDLQETRLLQVGHGDAPASFEVEVEAESDHVAQGPGGVTSKGGRQIAVTGVVDGVETDGVGDGGGEILVVEALVTRVEGRPVQGAAQLGDLDEVVEVARLE